MKMKSHSNLPNEDALIFCNGPYQLLVGYACVLKHLPTNKNVKVITYDMLWQPELIKVTKDFIKALKLTEKHIPLELKKSDINNFKTNKIATLFNHITFFLYVALNNDQNIFLPKIEGSPERAIILAARKKKVFIYDDGYGIYIDPKVKQTKLDRLIFKLIGGKQSNVKANITICPRKPTLMTYNNFYNVRISKIDYTDKLINILDILPTLVVNSNLLSICDNLVEKKIIIISLPRIALVNEQSFYKDIFSLIDSIGAYNPKVFFLIKPHPRDTVGQLEALDKFLMPLSNWNMFPSEVWGYPIEILSRICRAKLVLSGWSTVGINGDLIKNTKVMVFDFLSFNQPEYTKFAKMVMEKAKTHFGENIEDAIIAIKSTLAEN